TGGVFRIPRTPVIPTTPVLTGLGSIGIFVDGVAQFDSRDAFSQTCDPVKCYPCSRLKGHFS
ncbi:MAG: hypothetical protein AAGL98_10550, partial [Planctomycetota bacterium]